MRKEEILEILWKLGRCLRCFLIHRGDSKLSFYGCDTGLKYEMKQRNGGLRVDCGHAIAYWWLVDHESFHCQPNWIPYSTV